MDLPAHPEAVFTYGAPQLKFGPGASAEIGHDLGRYGVRRVLVVTDPGVAATGHPQRVADQMAGFGIEAKVFDGARVEPTDASLREAIEHARATGPWDAFVAVGGGSAIDTAKAINLMCTNPGELVDYVNAPMGGGRVREPPGSARRRAHHHGDRRESTTVCVLDVVDLRVKTGISHPRLRPTLAVVDPLLTLTQPAGVTAAAGMDILCHALESGRRDRTPPTSASSPTSGCPTAAPTRSRTCGPSGRWPCSPVVPRRRPRRVRPGRSRADVAGRDVRRDGLRQRRRAHPARQRLPHGRAGAGFHPDGYPDDHAMVPHGMAVALTAPEAFRFTFDADPERHVRAAELLAPSAERPSDLRDFLPGVLAELMRDIGLPSGLAEVGFDTSDVGSLVEGALKQQRLLATAPKDVTEDDLEGVLSASLENW